MKKLRVQGLTWNVGGSKPIKNDEFLRLLCFNPENTIDVYMICLQEIETGILETAKSFILYDDWTEMCISVLSKHGYYLVGNVRVQGLTLSVFSLLDHLPYLRFIQTDIERTGVLGSTWGDKGGVAVSVMCYGISVCFLNTHLESHLWHEEKRIDDIKEVLEEITFDNNTKILDHDIVFWSGDLNFRIDHIPRQTVLKLIKEKEYERMLKEDQLSKHLQHSNVFSQFTEGPITFQPTFKFDPGTDVYDTSEKQRKPAWTDRILYRVNPDRAFISDLVMSSLNISDSQTEEKTFAKQLVTQVEGSYSSHMEFRQSDHKPVTAQYHLKIPEVSTPLVELQVEKLWRSDRDCDVSITYHSKYVPSEGKDYLALYEGTFSHYQKYKSWKYVSEVKHSVEKPKIKHLIKYFCPKVEEKTTFRIGYYSHRMSCLLALTDPFVVKE